MSISTEQKAKIIADFQEVPGNTGSTEVQVALLSASIKSLTEHFKLYKKDNHSRRGLIRQVNQRKKLLKYLQLRDKSRYLKLIEALGLRK